MGLGELDGAEHEVDLSLVAEPRVGDYVIVHVGYALNRLDPDEAEKTLKLFAEIEAAPLPA